MVGVTWGMSPGLPHFTLTCMFYSWAVRLHSLTCLRFFFRVPVAGSVSLSNRNSKTGLEGILQGGMSPSLLITRRHDGLRCSLQPKTWLSIFFIMQMLPYFTHLDMICVQGLVPAAIRLVPQTVLTFIFLEQLRLHFGAVVVTWEEGSDPSRLYDFSGSPCGTVSSLMLFLQSQLTRNQLDNCGSPFLPMWWKKWSFKSL